MSTLNPVILQLPGTETQHSIVAGCCTNRHVDGDALGVGDRIFRERLQRLDDTLPPQAKIIVERRPPATEKLIELSAVFQRIRMRSHFAHFRSGVSQLGATAPNS